MTPRRGLRRSPCAPSSMSPGWQAHLALSHGTVVWQAFPSDVRDRVVTLWIELLRGYARAPPSPVERDA